MGVLPPKRYPGCQANCPDYIIDKAFHEAEREERAKKKHIKDGIYDQRSTAIEKTIGKRPKGFSYSIKKTD